VRQAEYVRVADGLDYKFVGKIWNMHEKFSENFMKNYCKKEIGSV